ncbi:hypothetical protein BX070DRAFT_247821 [Coemansia spiralis]|nr:hypothetical protein BX070DRAFT_247821 [Coemansia spiralis]
MTESVTKRRRSGASSGLSHITTPSRVAKTTVQSTDDPTKENEDLEARRRAICKVVREHLDESTYYIDDMVEDHLELVEEYSAFNSAVGGKFEGLVDEIMGSTHEEEHPAVSRSSRNKVEREKADYFRTLFLKMREFAACSIDDTRYNKTQYRHVDKQDTPVSVLEVKPTECNSKHIPDKTLGQIGDYVLSVWNEQPLRTFVPVLMLHGERLDLLLFTRSKVVKVMLGQIYRPPDQNIGIEEKSDMQNTLHDLWFILTLAPEKLGHICAVGGKQKKIIVEAKNDNLFVTGINTGGSARDGKIVLLNNRIKRPVNLFGRVAYLFRSQDKNPKDSLVAKISWIPTDRFSECTAYSTLHKNGVTGVPEVLYYGTLKADFFGYRMEILLLEDCGTPIIDHLGNISTPQNFMKCANRLAKYAKEAASTLIHAYDAGILHRDISAGNITVKGENAYVIDWGFSMFTDEKKSRELADNINSRMKDVLENEYRHNPFTGTPLYMSIQTLCGSSMRSIMHDIESLFMVVLHALAALNGSTEIADDAKYGWKFLGNEMMAALRVGNLAGPEKYLKRFGCVCEIPLELRQVLDSLYAFLFLDGGHYIGGKMLDNSDYERKFDFKAARGFLDDGALAKLQSIQQNCAMQEMDIDMFSTSAPMQHAIQPEQAKSDTKELLVPAPAVSANIPSVRAPVARKNSPKAPAPASRANIPQLRKRKAPSNENEKPLAQSPTRLRSQGNSKKVGVTQQTSLLPSKRATSTIANRRKNPSIPASTRQSRQILPPPTDNFNKNTASVSRKRQRK